MSVLATEERSAVETRQMSSVARTDISVASTHNVEVSEVSTVPMLKSQKSQLSQCSSLRSLNCGNVTMFKSQIGGLALNRRKWSEMGPEWSPGPENRPPGMPRPFSRLWDQSCSPNPPKHSPNSRTADICLVATHNVQVSDMSIVPTPQCSSPRQYHNVEVSDISIVAMSQCSPEMGTEWSPGPENRSPGMLWPLSRLWDRSRGPQLPKYRPNSRSTAPGGRYFHNLRVNLF